MTKKIILTGFKPFGFYHYNPTEECVNYFGFKISIPQIEIIPLVLPCSYFGAFDLLSKTIDTEKPDAIISMGLSSSVPCIRIETVFRNLMKGKYPDSNHYAPFGVKINEKGNAREFLSPQANHLFLANKLHLEDIPIELSANADTFICNSLGYLTTKKILEENLPIHNMFIHIPFTDDYKEKVELEPSKIFLEKEKFYKAIKLLIKNIC